MRPISNAKDKRYNWDEVFDWLVANVGTYHRLRDSPQDRRKDTRKLPNDSGPQREIKRARFKFPADLPWDFLKQICKTRTEAPRR